jgi:type II restriction enzyme
MKEFIKNSGKNAVNEKLINEALDILLQTGVPLAKKSVRGLQNMAMSFLAVAGVTKSWKEAKGQNENRHLTTREIIKYINQHYEENKSPGSYDDIRREHLKLLTFADLVLNSAKNPNAAPNDPRRGYTLHADFRNLITFYRSPPWDIKLKLFLKNRISLTESLERKRHISKIPVKLPSGILLELSQGGHNQLQREVVDEFLPRFANNADILYIGDASKRILHIRREELRALHFFELSHDALPDIVAYDKNRNWLFLIEVVFSSGTMNEERVFELKKMLKDCNAELIFITAFTSKTDFKKHASDIAWETEVWTADNPDHIIHFNGEKFMGPYKPNVGA